MKKLLLAGFMLASLATFAQTTITTTQETKQVVEREKDGNKWTLTLKNGDVESLVLNGKTIATKDYPKYQNAIDALTASAYGYEMPFDVKVTSKGLKEPVSRTQPISKTNYTYSESNSLTAEQRYANLKIEEELRNDFITSAYDKGFKLELTESYMVVNGELMQKAVVDKYANLYYRYTGEKRCDGCTFTVRINRSADAFAGER
jgi:hypothetical protein